MNNNIPATIEYGKDVPFAYSLKLGNIFVIFEAFSIAAAIIVLRIPTVISTETEFFKIDKYIAFFTASAPGNIGSDVV